MSRPTSRPPFSALICSILFTSDLPSRRRRVNTKKAPLPLEEKGTLASLRVRHRTLRAREPSGLKRRARSLARCGPRKLLKTSAFGARPLFAGWIDVAKESATTSEVLNSKASSRSLPAELVAPPPADTAPSSVPEPERTFSGAPLAPKTGGDDSEPDPDRAERHPYVARPGDRSKPVTGAAVCAWRGAWVARPSDQVSIEEDGNSRSSSFRRFPSLWFGEAF